MALKTPDLNVRFRPEADDRSASRPDLGFIRLAPIFCRALFIMKQSALAITSIEENNEISSNQTTNKTRASADTSENQ